MNNDEDNALKNIHAESMVSSTTAQPWVRLDWGPMSGQLSPAQARLHAYGLLETAFAAELDSFVFQWVRSRIGLDETAASAVLRDFREWRKQQPPLPQP